MSSKDRLIIATDVGGTMLRVAIADSNGRIIDKVTTQVPRETDATSVPLRIAELTSFLLSKHSEKGCLWRFSIAAIGPLDTKRGRIVKPANMPYDEVPLIEVLSKYFDTEFILINDCNAAVLAEKEFGAGRDYDDIVYITISSGIGGGAYIDGTLLMGKDGNAVEIGHTVIDASGKMVCGCGRLGHWEAYCGGNGMPRYAEYLAREEKLHIDSQLLKMLRGGYKITSKDIFDFARMGDEFALNFIDRVAELNAIGVANVVSIYDPSIITIGGSVALNNVDFIIERLKRRVEKYTINRVPKILPTPLGHDAPLLGAIVAALNPPSKALIKI